MKRTISIAIVDDHRLIANGLASLLSLPYNDNEGYDIKFIAENGKDMIEKLTQIGIPDIILCDVNMPVMDGYETTSWLKSNYPDIKVLAVSMSDSEQSIIRMLKNGAVGFIVKDCEPKDLLMAIISVIEKGYFFSDNVTSKMFNTLNNLEDDQKTIKPLITLSQREIEFLKLACTELHYKEIANEMSLSPRTIDGIKDTLFEKLGVKTRVGLVLYSIRNGLFEVAI